VTLLDRQLSRAVDDVDKIIRLSNVTATLYRPVVAGENSFYGPCESSETTIGSISVEVKDLSPTDLAEIGADAVASVLPNSGVKEQDFLKIGSTRYRVTEVKQQNLFGKITHLDLHLELEKKGS